MFDMIIGQAIDIFTEDDWDLIDYMSFSSVGWNTGVGLLAFGSDKLEQMEKFREVLRNLKIGNKRFESYPKRMLLNRYAITIYFNSAFAWSTVPKLLFWFRKLNGFEGNLTMAETRHYPDDHPTRKGCKIVACEADQKFLDELYCYPKDHAFSIRYGGNLYVRGGDRIDPDDPNAVRPQRPRLSRQAAKTFISGSGEDILNEGQRQDDRAKKNYEWKNVGFRMLWAHNLLTVHSDTRCSTVQDIGEELSPKHYFITTYLCSRTSNKQQSSEEILCNVNFNILGNGKVGLHERYVQIIARSRVGMFINSNDEVNYRINYESNNVKLEIKCNLINCKSKINRIVNYSCIGIIYTARTRSDEKGRGLNTKELNGTLDGRPALVRIATIDIQLYALKMVHSRYITMMGKLGTSFSAGKQSIDSVLLFGDIIISGTGKTRRRRSLQDIQSKLVIKVRTRCIMGFMPRRNGRTVYEGKYHKENDSTNIKIEIKCKLVKSMIKTRANVVKQGKQIKGRKTASCNGKE